MSKIVRRIRPGDYWRIGMHECWFEDMAAKGLHLKKMKAIFAHFEKGEPKSTRYRIDISVRRGISPQQKQLYAEGGWDYVTSYGVFNVFSSPAEAKAPELHTDPMEQAYTLKELDKRFVFNTVITIASTIVMFILLYFVIFGIQPPILSLIEGAAVQQIIMAVFFLYALVSTMQAAISIRRLRKNLMAGVPLDHRTPWRKNKIFACVVAVVYMLSLITVALPIIQLSRMGAKNLPIAVDALPIVRLAEVENNPNLVREVSQYSKDIDMNNQYYSNWSLLAPIQYDTTESGRVPNEIWRDSSREYSPSMSTRVYRLRMSSLAEGLIKDLIDRYSWAYRGGEYIRLENPNFDILIVHEEEHYKEVFAAKGKGVMYVRYNGYAELEAVIAATAKRIELISH